MREWLTVGDSDEALWGKLIAEAVAFGHQRSST
jgi:hypothetical protein